MPKNVLYSEVELLNDNSVCATVSGFYFTHPGSDFRELHNTTNLVNIFRWLSIWTGGGVTLEPWFFDWNVLVQSSCIDDKLKFALNAH